jgi:hypothetical protein
MSSTLSPRLGNGARTGLFLVAALALVYAIPAFSFLFNLDAGLAWLHAWYSTLVSENYASAPLAYENAQRAYLHEMSPFMKLHVGGMATALGLGWIQFVPAWRARPQLHRALGSLFLLGIFLGGAGAVGMVFGGNTYGSANAAMQLTVEQGMLMLAAMMWLSALVAMRWLVAGDLRRHGDWMVMAYALVCTAIPQRIGFVVYGWLGHDYETSFQLTTQFIVQPMVLLAIWIIAERRWSNARHTEALPSTAAFISRLPALPAAAHLPWLFGSTGAAFIMLAIADWLPFSGFTYHNGVRLNVGAVGVALLVAAWKMRAALLAARPEATAQWLLRGVVMLLLPLFALGTWVTLLPTGKSTEILLNTAPVFAAGAVFFLPEILISAFAWLARRREQGRVDERGALKVLLRPLPGKAHAFSDFLAISFGMAQTLMFLAFAIPAFALWAVLWLLDRVPGFKSLRLFLYRPIGALAEALGRRMLADQRDMPVMHVIVQISLTIIPVFVLQMAMGEFSLALWAIYMTFLLGPKIVQYQRLFSCAHNEGHRVQGFFKTEVHRYTKRYFENFLGHLFGEVQGNVGQGHVRVHHVEDAGYEDVQCIAHYNRTNPLDFMRFIGRENLLNNSGISLLDYFRTKGREKQFLEVRNGALLHLGFLAAVAVVDWRIALAYVLVPKLMFNVVTGGATFAQHAFYKPENIHDVLACTTTFIFENDFLNEGYHMSHHQRCAVHWTQMPEFFAANIPLYREHDAVVFKGIDTLEVFMLLMLNRLDLLAPYVMDLHGGRNLQEIEAWLRLRTSAVPGVQRMQLQQKKMPTPAVAMAA